MKITTRKLMQMEKEVIKLGWYEMYPQKKDFCYEVAKAADELGQEYPSENALEIAEQMLDKLKKEVN